MPPVPVEPLAVTPEDVGPVGHPPNILPRDVGPVHHPPELPDWLQEEAKIRAPDINLPNMPRDIVHEGRYGIDVKPQPSDYVAPPVTMPEDPRELVGTPEGPPDDFIADRLISAGEDNRRRLEAFSTLHDFSKDLELKDLGMGLLRGTSRYTAGLGQTHGRFIGEGIL